jgi:hypothetical protein
MTTKRPTYGRGFNNARDGIKRKIRQLARSVGIDGPDGGIYIPKEALFDYIMKMDDRARKR